MRVTRLAALAAAAAAVFVTPALAVFAADVTIQARLFIQESSASRQVELTGAVANADAGETVEILAKDCGPNHRFYRVVAGVKTVTGGRWRIVSNAPPTYVQLPTNAYFRARWRGTQSEPALVRVPAFVSVAWRPRLRRADVSVSTGQSGQNIRRRVVELQRKVAGTSQWVRVRRARLGRGTYEGFFGQVFKARFSVPTRGLTLRVLVPDESGAPCFAAGFSQEFRS